MKLSKFFITTALLTGAIAVGPAYLPEPVQKALRIPPIYLASIPYVQTPQKDLLHTVNQQFADAPDVVHALAVGIALDPLYPAAAVRNVSPDLLSDAYVHKTVGLDDGMGLVVHNSILSQALRYGRFDLIDMVIAKAGVETNAAKRLAIECALIAHEDEQARRNAQHYLEVFARAGGSASRTRQLSNDKSLAEILLERDRDALMYFVNAGFEPFMSLDQRFYDHGGMSLGEIATLQGNFKQLRAVHYLLNKGGVPQPDFRVSVNMLSNIESRLLPDEFDTLIEELRVRSTPIDLSE